MKYHECNLLQNSILTRKTGNNLASRKKVRMQELRCCLQCPRRKKSWINEFYAMTLKWYASLIKVAWLVFPDQNHDLIFFDSHLELKKEVWHDQRYWDANTHTVHSSLLSTFGFSASSTYDSCFPLIFGKFALIWGHFQNICVCLFESIEVAKVKQPRNPKRQKL